MENGILHIVVIYDYIIHYFKYYSYCLHSKSTLFLQMIAKINTDNLYK